MLMDIGKKNQILHKTETMEDKHFEPVTARSLARDFYSKAMAIKNRNDK